MPEVPNIYIHSIKLKLRVRNEMSKKRRNINALIVLAVIFTGFTMINAFNIAFRMNEYIHHSRSGASSVYVDSTDLLGNHSYKVQITMTDVDDDNAIVQGSVEIFVNNELVTTLTFSDYDWPNGDDEDASASDSEEIWLYPDDDSILQVVIYMDGGDQWSYVLFEDLPIELEQQGFLYAM